MPLSPANRPVILAWCLYDWANSAFTTLVVTFVYATYFTQAIAPDVTRGTQLWSWAVGGSAILVALLSPLLGWLADRAGTRRRWLITATLIAVAATGLLALVRPGMRSAVPAALLLFMVANVAYEIGIVFYNAYLPDIAPADKIGTVSGCGWGAGYLGGIACLALALVAFVSEPPLLPLDTAHGFHIRATNLLVAGWFLLFSLPLFARVRDRRTVGFRFEPAVLAASLVQTWRDLRGYRQVLRLLVARLLYNDGLVTVFAFGGIYAAGTFGMTLREVLVFGLALNLAAGLGAFVFGFIDDRVGGRRTVLVSLVALIGAILMAVVAQDKAWFWAAGIAIGIFVGPNQSASRSLLGRFVPARHQAEFYGLFSLSGKLTSFAGPLLLGAVTAATGSQRAGVASVLAFFVAGGLLLLRVDEAEGIAEARTQKGEPAA